jgi:oxygen-independent coproporphyrinogen-3 oxidase
MPPDHRLDILKDIDHGVSQQGSGTPGAHAVADALRAGPVLDALYLHVPFCFHKCHYCDFYSLVDGPGRDRQPAFADALIAELRHVQATHDARPKTVFVGGGTPTLLRPELWAPLLDTLRAQGWLDACDEFTVEANPETVTPELLAQLAAGGVNRVSDGSIQPDFF